MKGVDSSVLLGLLEGDAAVRSLLKHLRGLEVATTEADLLELAWLAGTGTKRERRHRLETLSRLRRRITVLPLDARATDQTVRIALRGESGGALPLSLGRLGALEAAGCEELYTRDPTVVGASSKLKISIVGRKTPK